jgi:hypothetical protein
MKFIFVPFVTPCSAVAIYRGFTEQEVVDCTLLQNVRLFLRYLTLKIKAVRFSERPVNIGFTYKITVTHLNEGSLYLPAYFAQRSVYRVPEHTRFIV